MSLIEVKIKKPQPIVPPNATGRRLGQFTINTVEIDPDRWGKLLGLFAQMVIVRCEMRYDSDAFHYTAYSPLFDDCGDCLPPTYVIIYDSVKNEWSAEKWI